MFFCLSLDIMNTHHCQNPGSAPASKHIHLPTHMYTSNIGSHRSMRKNVRRWTNRSSYSTPGSRTRIFLLSPTPPPPCSRCLLPLSTPPPSRLPFFFQSKARLLLRCWSSGGSAVDCCYCLLRLYCEQGHQEQAHEQVGHPWILKYSAGAAMVSVASCRCYSLASLLLVENRR